MFTVAKWVVMGSSVWLMSGWVHAATVYGPLPESYCELLQTDAGEALGIEFDLSLDAPFSDYLSGDDGTGCQMQAIGDGTQFGDPRDILNSLREAFVGWEEDEAYQASGGFGESMGLRRDAGLLLVSASWTAAEDASCHPEEDADCELADEERIYTIDINVAMQ